MFMQLIDRSPDLKKLRDEGYNILIISNHLVVKDVPYVNSEKRIQYGILVSELTISQNIRVYFFLSTINNNYELFMFGLSTLLIIRINHSNLLLNLNSLNFIINKNSLSLFCFIIFRPFPIMPVTVSFQSILFPFFGGCPCYLRTGDFHMGKFLAIPIMFFCSALRIIGNTFINRFFALPYNS